MIDCDLLVLPLSTPHNGSDNEVSPGWLNRAVFRKKTIGGGRGVNMDRVAKGHCEGEGAGGGCAPSCAERIAETTSSSILQSEWEAKRGPLQYYKKHSSTLEIGTVGGNWSLRITGNNGF